MIYQCVKLSQQEWDAYLDRLFHLKYELLAIPEPSLVVYVRADPEISQKLMASRYQDLEEKKGIHEKNVEHLKHCQIVAGYCAAKCGWKAIECVSNGETRSIEDLQKEIIE